MTLGHAAIGRNSAGTLASLRASNDQHLIDGLHWPVDGLTQSTGGAMEEIGTHVTGLNEIAIVALVAVLLGFVLMRLRQPPIVGYILAGVVLGPTGLGVVHQSHSIELLAELGVLLLLFLIGMEISIRAFVLVLRPATLIASGQITAALGITTLFGLWQGWTWQQILLLGFVVAVSSTAVTIKILEEIDELRTETGRITVGVMIAQDIAIVPMLILADAFGNKEPPGLEIATKITLAVAILGMLIWYLGRPGKLRLPFTEMIEGRPDVIALAALAFCFTTGTITSLFGLSPVYGAFLAGLIIANSTLRHDAIQVTHPVQSILLFVFFLSIGLLIDLDFISSNITMVLTFAFGVVLVKTVLNVALTRAVGFSWSVATPAGLAMAQVGEFSFILAAAGLRNGVLDGDTYRLALSVIALSILISPLWMLAARRIHNAADEGLNTLRDVVNELDTTGVTTLAQSHHPAARPVRIARIYGRASLLAWRRHRNRPKIRSPKQDAD